MRTMNGKDRLTRRGFLELSSGAIATAGLLPDVNPARVAPRPGETVDTAKPDSAQMTGKIALEEHFTLPEAISLGGYPLGGRPSTPEFRLQILDLGSGRIAEMDRGGE